MGNIRKDYFLGFALEDESFGFCGATARGLPVPDIPFWSICALIPSRSFVGFWALCSLIGELSEMASHWKMNLWAAAELWQGYCYSQEQRLHPS